ncbi:MFS transporter [Ensifer sp. ENS04]|uniref:MFS transporter n=1 Tax=Ensifer sp. ENS04 TaxID=2769281 RepID=UPI001785255C|nr:MFS transporter [Ensifer sp. ENS04]MBD9541410.1 MFS transporter [Ensifer sp. ENS04]
MDRKRSSAAEISTWCAVAIGFITLALAYTVRGALSLAMPLWQVEFGWSRSFISGIAAAALLVMAVVAPFAGRLADRRGPRSLLIFGLGAVGIGVFLAAVAHREVAPWLLPVGFAGVAAIGFGVIAQHTVAAAIAQRAVTNRGLAIGIGTAGSTAGQLFLMPLLAIMMQTGEWRRAFVLLGAACLLLIPVTWVLLGRQAGPTGPAVVGRGGSHSDRSSLRRLAQSPAFHAIHWSYTLCGFTTSGVIETHLMPYATLCGFGTLPSATSYGVLSALNLVGMIAAGWMSDRLHRPALLAFIYVARALAFILLIFVANSYPLLIVFAVLFGLFDYSTVPVTSSYLASRMGTEVLGLSMGILSAGHAIGAAAGAWAGGALYDLSGDYNLLWPVSAGLALVAAILVIGLSDSQRIGNKVGNPIEA